MTVDTTETTAGSTIGTAAAVPPTFPADPARSWPFISAAGTELLAFEGEIALVIGTNARWVPKAQAWDCVTWVTASNDFRAVRPAGDRQGFRRPRLVGTTNDLGAA